jgi:hypothetical protein
MDGYGSNCLKFITQNKGNVFIVPFTRSTPLFPLSDDLFTSFLIKKAVQTRSSFICSLVAFAYFSLLPPCPSQSWRGWLLSCTTLYLLLLHFHSALDREHFKHLLSKLFLASPNKEV